MDIADKILWIIERFFGYFGQGDVINSIRVNRKQKMENSKIFETIFSFYYPRIKVEFQTISSAQNLNQEQAYRYWIDNQPALKNLTPSQKNILVLMVLCHEYDLTKKPETNSAIREYLSTFNITFADISENVKMLLCAYDRLFNTKNSYELDGLFLILNIDHVEKLNEFSNKYSKDIAFQYVIKKLNQSEEFRNTLIKLIRDGKLATFGLNQQTLTILEAELRKKTEYTKTFLILANKIPISVETYIKSQPGFTGRPINPRNIPWFKGSHMFSMYIIRPNEGFQSGDEFLKKIQYLSTGFNEESLITILPIDGINAKQFTIPSNRSFTNENIKKACDISSYFITGAPLADQDIWNVITQSEIGIIEILALMPFNILVPGIYPSEKDFLIKHYSKVQEKMHVGSLIDWASVDVSLLEQTLKSLGEINYSAEERKIIETQDRLRYIAEDIVRNSQLFKKSLSLLV